ncbi:hypothetical protein GCM10009841_19860 [Microlunatus panaciterrae]
MSDLANFGVTLDSDTRTRTHDPPTCGLPGVAQQNVATALVRDEEPVSHRSALEITPDAG